VTARAIFSRATVRRDGTADRRNAHRVSDALDRKIADMGWTGMLVPSRTQVSSRRSRHGGPARRVRPRASGRLLLLVVLATQALVRAGDREQKREWLPKLASGQATATLALLEESDRLDAAVCALAPNVSAPAIVCRKEALRSLRAIGGPARHGVADERHR